MLGMIKLLLFIGIDYIIMYQKQNILGRNVQYFEIKR